MPITSELLSYLMRRRLHLAALCLLGAAMLVGCGRELSVPSTAPVKGMVKFMGKPASGIRVTFHSQQKTKRPGFVPTGETGADGSFALSTGAPLNGAPPGSYVVTFEKPELDPKTAVETEIDAFKGKYSDPAQSKWTITIERGENVLPPFELQ